MPVLFCYECYDEREVRFEQRNLTIPVRGEAITVAGTLPICTVCNHQISSPETDNANLLLAYREYRQRHELLQPEEIAEIRSRYGLSQRKLARLLGWGQITIQRYESGTLQDGAHNHLLRAMRDPVFVAALLDSSDCKLTEAEKKAVLTRLASGREQSLRDQALASIEEYLSCDEPSEFTGFRRPSLDKLAGTALYFAHRVDGYLFKVKLFKMLFYADFLHCARRGVSITGFPYAALGMGPVPDRFQSVLAWIDGVGLARVDDVPLSFGTGEALVPLVPFEPVDFSSDELDDMEAVLDQFGTATGSDLIKISHQEPGWLNTERAQRISYKWARELRAIR